MPSCLERILIMRIRANTGTVDIEVNDSGDKISFSMSDNNFIKRISCFFEWFFGAQKDIEKFSGKEINELKEFNQLVSEQECLSNQAMAKLDELFGDGTSKKIFGEFSPTFDCVADAIFQLFEEIEKIREKYNQDLSSRYSRNRKGARSK